jgi:hypothetical protein
VNKFLSEIEERKPSLKFPEWGGTRIQLMPIIMHDHNSIPLGIWERYGFVIATMFREVDNIEGVGYLTIDERFVPQGHYHRRPGLHVDGMGDWGKGGAWAGGGDGPGMLMASNEPACIAYPQEFTGAPYDPGDPSDPMEGNCEHLREQCLKGISLKANVVYACSPLCVHETVPVTQDCFRQFVRMSMPSSCGWPANCTPNPLGIKPKGPIVMPRRVTGEYSYSE